ncbi:MAG: sialidase family protein [Bryobacterales bacterium]|nr:sialidase family protein [Bryobacterales bacterium]
MISRRSFFLNSSIGLAGGSGLLIRSKAEAQQVANAGAEAIRTISQLPERYHGWSTIARDAKGTLFVVVSGGRESHVCPFGRVELMRSHDEGLSWTWPETLMDSAIDDRDAGICVSPAGSLLVTTFTSLAYEAILAKSSDWPEERRGRWQAAHSRVSGEQRKGLLGTWMLRSTNGGVTWSSPYRVPMNSPHGPVALRDGRLLYAGKSMWSNEERVGVAASSDDGQTWKWLNDLPIRKGDTTGEYHELHAVEAPSGKLIVQIRNHSATNQRETLQTESIDGGKTWTEPHSIGVWGLPSHLLRLRSGRLLMAYGYRRAPFGNQARWSDDEGASWSNPVTISGDGAAGDLGYPSTVELADGGLYTVWYEKLAASPNAVLRARRWRIPG